MRRIAIALTAFAALLAGCGERAETSEPAAVPAVEAPPPEMPADAPPQEEVAPEVAAGAGAAAAPSGADDPAAGLTPPA